MAIGTLQTIEGKPDITYPVRWVFKLMGRSEEAMRDAVAEVCVGREVTLSRGNTSRTGKFCTLNLELLIVSDEERLYLYEALGRHEAVSMIL
ncbi:MAG: DUF493 domain-containing protein [Campylobacterales bacterium]